MRVVILCFFCLSLVSCVYAGKPNKYVYHPQGGKYENINYVKDRPEKEIYKPEMPDKWVNRLKKKYHPAWMDYCDPYHCNDYHKTACGLHRASHSFKWFQSGCHIVLNNQCAKYRGHLIYDVVETRFCATYVMFKRQSCPKPDDCEEDEDPVCGKSTIDGHVVLFKNKCHMDIRNCNTNQVVDEYTEIPLHICKTFYYYATLTRKNNDEINKTTGEKL